MTPRRLKSEVLVAGLDDYVALWEIAFDAERNAALETVSELLEEGLAVAGTPTPDGGFEVADESPQETVRRVGREWDELGRAPDVGESSVWLELTAEGEKLARELEA